MVAVGAAGGQMIRSTLVHRRALVTVLAAVLVMASCSGDDDASEASDETTTTTAAETTAPPTTLSPEEEVEAAFHQWVNVMIELGGAPNPDDPRLPEMVLEPQLGEIRESFSEAVAKNEAYERGSESRYEILDTTIDASGLNATITVCVIGADKLIDRDTGTVVSEGVSTLREEASYQRQDNRWMLASYQNTQSWDGVRSCEQ